MAFLLLSIVLSVLLLSTGVAVAEEEYSLDQDTTVVLDAVGAAHVTQVLVYNESLWGAVVQDFTEHPQFLRRDLEELISVGAVTNFASTTDAATRTITLTWDEPGMAFNQSDRWELWALGIAPDEVEGVEAVWRGDEPTYGPLTDWNGAETKWTSTYTVPAAATDLKWDDAESKLVYALPYVPPEPAGNLLQQNTMIFVPLFAVLLVAGVAGIVLVLLRSRSVGGKVLDAKQAQLVLGPEAILVGAGTPSIGPGPVGLPPTYEPPAAAPPSPPDGPVTPPPASSAPAPPPSPEAPVAPPPASDAPVASQSPAGEEQAKAEAETAVTTVPDDEHPRFCGHCGHALTSDQRFCPGCGKPVA